MGLNALKDPYQLPHLLRILSDFCRAAFLKCLLSSRKSSRLYVNIYAYISEMRSLNEFIVA